MFVLSPLNLTPICTRKGEEAVSRFKKNKSTILKMEAVDGKKNFTG